MDFHDKANWKLIERLWQFKIVKCCTNQIFLNEKFKWYKAISKLKCKNLDSHNLSVFFLKNCVYSAFIV